MDTSQVLEQTKNKLQDAIDHFVDDLKKLRTGRASASMLDGIMVEAYGSKIPLMQVGNISIPEPQLLQITPFDPNNLQAICASIREEQALGLNPMDDGRVVRVPIPPLTTERRQQIVKLLGSKVEDCMIRMRQIRHDALKQVEQSKKDKSISDDDYSRMEKQVGEYVSQQKKVVEELSKEKESEIMTL